MTGGGFRPDAAVAAARRFAGVSQRELAEGLGIAPSMVASIESGAKRPSVDLLDRLLRTAGLRLAVVDGSGSEVMPFPVDAVRDNAGRRFPAHLDVLSPDQVPLSRAQFPRYDRAPAKGWYHLRSGPQPSHEPGRVGPSRPDHPTDAVVEYRRQKQLYGRSPWWPTREAALRAGLGLAPAPEDD